MSGKLNKAVKTVQYTEFIIEYSTTFYGDNI